MKRAAFQLMDEYRKMLIEEHLCVTVSVDVVK